MATFTKFNSFVEALAEKVHNLAQAHTLAMGQGTFTLTGQSATFYRSIANLVMGVGSFVLTGQALAFINSWTNQAKNSSTWTNQNK